MKTIKTARGKILDMAGLAAQNEETRAISNMPINARGDIIDNRGKVKVPREDISKEFYKNNVPGSDVKKESIKEDVTLKTVVKETPEPKPEPTPAPAPVAKEEDDNIEVSRSERERPDGSKYFEVEYMDGSMEEIEIPQDNKSKK
tara:strand:+ start:917 stop:1351 length:435 start_codon:yes stop_codon:yes gene_type:complete